MDSDSRQSDEEVIERVKRAERMRVEVGTQHGPWFTETLDLAARLQSALTRISSLERELGASDAALIADICKEPPCMYGTNERIYIMSKIEARRRSVT